MLAVYVVGRAVLRAVFSPQSLPLAWPLQIAVLMVIGLVVIGALYVAAAVSIARWIWRVAVR
jgi:hypothetical protein